MVDKFMFRAPFTMGAKLGDSVLTRNVTTASYQLLLDKEKVQMLEYTLVVVFFLFTHNNTLVHSAWQIQQFLENK